MVIQDTSRSIQLATAPNEALQEVFTIIGSVRRHFMIFYLFQDLFTINKPLFLFIIFSPFQGLFTILIWLVSTSYQSSEAETTSDEAHQRSSQVECCALADYTFDLLKLKTLNLSTIPILIFQKINY